MSLSQDIWRININVRDHIVSHYTPYDGDDAFLTPPSAGTRALWRKVSALMDEERARGGLYDIDNTTISTITSHAPGYIDRDIERIAPEMFRDALDRPIARPQPHHLGVAR